MRLQSRLLRNRGLSLRATFRLRPLVTAQLGVYLAAINFAFLTDALGVERVVVYNSVKNVLARATAEQFEKETGTEVRLVPNNRQGTSKELLDRLIAEKKHTQADVFWSCDPVSAFGTLVIPAALVLKQHGLNPEQGKRFIDFLLRSDIQKLLGEDQVIPSLDKIKPMEVDFSKLESESKELSRGFLSRWVWTQK